MALVIDSTEAAAIARRVGEMMLSDQSWPAPPDMSEWPPETLAESAWKHGFSAAIYAAKHGT